MTRNIVRSFALFSTLALAPIFGTAMMPSHAQAQTVTDNNDLVARHQVRLDTVDSQLRELRGVLETDLRSLRIQLDQITEIADSADLSVSKLRRELSQEVARLDDTIEIMEQRLRRTIELSSDIEFRVLRLEKRLDTLIALNIGGQDLTTNPQSAPVIIGRANTADDPDRTAGSDTLAAGQAPTVVISRDEDTGETVWTVNEDQLNSALQADNTGALSNAADAPANADSVDLDNVSTDAAATDGLSEASSALATEAEAEAASLPSVLPDTEPEAQFTFALNRALQNELDIAEQAFEEFRAVNPDHSRAADSLFWLGRVQLMQGQYEKSAMTFTTFNSEYPNDSRIVDTTLFIAESVSQFAEPEQACAIYASLPQLLDAPTENFTKRIGELANSAGCN